MSRDRFGPVEVHRWERTSDDQPMTEEEYAEAMATAVARLADADCFQLTTVDPDGHARYLTVGRRTSTGQLLLMVQATREHLNRVERELWPHPWEGG